MKDFIDFRNALYRLCTGEYSETDIQFVVGKLTRQVRRFIFHREKKRYRFRGDWENGSAEIDDLALDFIAPLFARDEQGRFIELARYFNGSWSLSDADLLEEVYQLLNGVVQQQSIRLFKERDPFGRVFYRSLRYLLNKHPDWIRTAAEGKAVVTHRQNPVQLLSSEEVEQVLKQSMQGILSLTEQMEQILTVALDGQEKAVVVDHLLSHLRKYAEFSLEDNAAAQTTEETDSFLHNTIRRSIEKTVQELDRTVLANYEEKGKLTCEEREGFRLALERILSEMVNGGCESSYFEYLSEFLDRVNHIGVYQSKYRVQFEYAAKKAKALFSVKIENALSIHY